MKRAKPALAMGGHNGCNIIKKRMDISGPSFCMVAFDVGGGRRKQMQHHYYKKRNQCLGLVSN
jgi:hypothetical protein